MPKAKRILIIEDMKEYSPKFLLSGLRKQIKGYVRLGHDVHVFNYGDAFWHVAPVMSKLMKRRWCKQYVDDLLAKVIGSYGPDIVHLSFANFIDGSTVDRIRQTVPNAFLLSIDGDPWPELQANRVEIASKLDFVFATNNGKWLDVYRKAGVPCAFLPNPCDPDINYRYDVEGRWKTDILFTGKTKLNKRYPTDPMRHELISRLAGMDNATLYGCFGRPRIDGMDYLYAISGARIALSINLANDVSMCHSDRLTHYLACGTFVLAKRVPDADLLFKDGVHLRYFDTIDEFFELADWHLAHEEERAGIAECGMRHIHAEFNGQKLAKYILDVVDHGSYEAPWWPCR